MEGTLIGFDVPVNNAEVSEGLHDNIVTWNEDTSKDIKIYLDWVAFLHQMNERKRLSIINLDLQLMDSPDKVARENWIQLIFYI